MTKRISKSEFKPRMLALLRDVEATGEPLIVTDHGKPVVRIEPYVEGDDLLATLRECILRYDDPIEPVDPQAWEANR